MTRKTWPVCSWDGVASDELEVVMCDRPACAVVYAPDGGAHYACRDHLAHVQARARTGDGLRAINKYAAPPGEHHPVRVQVLLA